LNPFEYLVLVGTKKNIDAISRVKPKVTSDVFGNLQFVFPTGEQ
jgi:hypothetical protein